MSVGYEYRTGANLTLKGMDGLYAALKELEAKTALSALRKAGRKSFVPVLEAAKARAPVDTGVLRDSIVIGTQKLGGDGDGVVAIGLKVRKTHGGRWSNRGPSAASKLLASAPLIAAALRDASWRWHFIETGAPARGLSPRPFLRPALDSQAQTVLENLAAELRKEIEKRSGK